MEYEKFEEFVPQSYLETGNLFQKFLEGRGYKNCRSSCYYSAGNATLIGVDVSPGGRALSIYTGGGVPRHIQKGGS